MTLFIGAFEIVLGGLLALLVFAFLIALATKLLGE